MVISEEIYKAYELRAKIRGIDTDELIKSELGDGVTVELKKKRKKSTVNNKKEVKNEIKTSEFKIDERYKFLDRDDLYIDILFKRHNIPYKNQLWPVPERTVRYKFEIVKSTGSSKKLLECYGLTEYKHKQDVLSGNIIFLELASYIESRPTREVSVADLMVYTNDDGIITYRFRVNNKTLKDANAIPEIVMNDIKNLINRLFREARGDE